ncbi:MAG: arginine repressor, partial [Gemmatimonadales bacterium]
MSQKQERQRVIQELVATRSVSSQEELRQLLAERGWEVTQSTLSRDMHDLRVARVPMPGGVRYTTADSSNSAENRATLASLLPQLFQ